MKYLNRHPLNEMAYNVDPTNFEVKEFVESSQAFNDIIALLPEKVEELKPGSAYKIEKTGTIIFLDRLFAQRNTVEKNTDRTWRFETREQVKKPDGAGYKLMLKTENYDTLENCLRHLWSYLIARKIDPIFDRAAKRKELNDTNEQKYWGEKLTLKEIIRREETLLDKKKLEDLVEDLNDKFNQFGLIFEYDASKFGSCKIYSNLSAIRGSLLSLLVNNKPNMGILNRDINISITNNGEKGFDYVHTIMPRTMKEAYNGILRGIITTYSDTNLSDRLQGLEYIKNLIIMYVKLNLENPNLPKAHSLFDLYKSFYNDLDIIPLLILAKLELKNIITHKIADGYRDDIDDFISKTGGNKYTFSLAELYEDMSKWMVRPCDITNIEEFKAYIIGIIHNLGLITNIVKDNVMISIP